MPRIPAWKRPGWLSVAAGRIGPAHDLFSALEWARFFAERFVLLPAATWLPAGAALAVADAVGAADAFLPSGTRTVTRIELSAAGVPAAELGRMVRARLAMPRRDIVWRQRMTRGREHIGDWTVTEHNGDAVHDLVAAKVSFVVASGHFTSSAGDLRHKVLPLDGRSVSGAVPRWRISPFELRRRLDAQVDEGSRVGLMQLGAPGKRLADFRAEMPDAWERGVDWNELPVYRNVQDEVLAELKTPGAACQLLIDAWWDRPTAYRRPFAGMAERGFALGAARIARIAQCPIVPFVAVLGDRPRTVVFEWGDPIPPAAPRDKDSDRKVIDTALAFLEQVIARYPDQYLHPIGSDRRYDHATKTFKPVRTHGQRDA